MCGPRLTKKIEEFVFQVSVQAGLPLNELLTEVKEEPNYGTT